MLFIEHVFMVWLLKLLDCMALCCAALQQLKNSYDCERLDGDRFMRGDHVLCSCFLHEVVERYPGC